MFRYLTVFILFTNFSFGQIVLTQNQTDATIGIDRKAFNGLGNTSQNSDGYAHDFTLPARSNSCEQITEIRVDINITGYTNTGGCNHTRLYYNLFYGCSQYAGGATCLPATNLIAEPNYPPNTSPTPFIFGNPLGSPRNSNIIPDFGDNLSIDIIPVSNPGCYPVTNGNINYQYTITVTVTVTNVIPTQPPVVNCWDNWVLNTSACVWDNIGTQPLQPALDCWETATFNTTSCSWDVAGTQPLQPALDCWQTATFNSTTCSWDVAGTQPLQPALDCWQTATFNSTSCSWDVTGTQPLQPALDCWETATFNTTTCSWDVTGTQPLQPALDCWETATFNTITCSWDVTGTQPLQPALDCWETATFNTITCSWDVTGTQPLQPALDCWETATFNTITCSWDVTGTQPLQPALACWETATFNSTTCSWDVAGTQPLQPALACWETATFNSTTCSWDVAGTQPGTVFEENLYLCERTTLNLVAQTSIANPSFVWSTGAMTNMINIDTAGTFTVNITGGICSFETIIFNVAISELPIIETVVSNDNNIIITTSNTGDFLYSLDGHVYQTSNTFFNLEGGLYTIYTKASNCTDVVTTTFLHFYVPKYFTPNNDGFNDTFSLSGIEFYANTQVSIFNRHGKLLKFSKNKSFSWDGTFNNIQLPSDDYWYVIIIDGQKITGHFTLKR